MIKTKNDLTMTDLDRKTRATVIRELRKVMACSKDYLRDKYGWDIVRKIKNMKELGFTKHMVYHTKSLFKSPKSMKELAEMLDLKREAIAYNFDPMVEDGILESIHIDGSEKFFYLKGTRINPLELYRCDTKQEILSVLKMSPVQTDDLVKILSINRNTLLSSLSHLRDEGIVGSVNAVGGGNNNFYWYHADRPDHEKIAMIWAIEMEGCVKLLHDHPARNGEIRDVIGLSKGTVNHKIRRLMEVDAVKRFKNGRYFVYYLGEHQENSAKIESLSSRQRFIYDLLTERKMGVLAIRDECGFKNDEGYRVRNAMETLLKFDLVKEVGEEVYVARELMSKRRETIYDQLLLCKERLNTIRKTPLYEMDDDAFRDLFKCSPHPFRNKKQLECLIISTQYSLSHSFVYNYLINHSEYLVPESEMDHFGGRILTDFWLDDLVEYAYENGERVFYLTPRHENVFLEWFEHKKSFYKAFINGFKRDHSLNVVVEYERALEKVKELEKWYRS